MVPRAQVEHKMFRRRTTTEGNSRDMLVSSQQLNQLHGHNNNNDQGCLSMDTSTGYRSKTMPIYAYSMLC